MKNHSVREEKRFRAPLATTTPTWGVTAGRGCGTGKLEKPQPRVVWAEGTDNTKTFQREAHVRKKGRLGGKRWWPRKFQNKRKEKRKKGKKEKKKKKKKKRRKKKSREKKRNKTNSRLSQN